MTDASAGDDDVEGEQGQSRPDWRGIRESALEALEDADAAAVVAVSLDSAGGVDENSAAFINHDELSSAELIGVGELLKAGLQEELDRLPDLAESRSPSEPPSLLEDLAENATVVSMSEAIEQDDEEPDEPDRGKGGIFR